jgi:glycosyltransferase involved in cell wall biosynthesis
VLIVNDGSTDETEKIANEYVQKDNRFQLFSKENGGTGSALNYGFKRAKGEFGTWVSSDDRKTNNYIEVLVNCLKRNRDIEFVVSSFYSEYLNKEVRTAVSDISSITGYKVQHILSPAATCLGDGSGEKNNNIFFLDNWVEINHNACHLGVNFMWTMRLKRKVGDFLEIPGEDYHMAILMGLNSRTAWVDKILGTHNSPADALSNIDRSCVNEANILTTRLIKKEYRPWYLKNIPKVAHFYWGAEKMSYMRYMTINSFKKMNPDWSVKLYIPKQLNSEKTWKDSFHQSDTEDYLSEGDYFEKLKEMAIKIIKVDFPEHIKRLGEAQKSDYLRWRVLYKEGGLWSDMDIIYHSPISNIYINKMKNKEVDNTISIIPDTGNSHQIGFYLSRPKNPMFKELCMLSSTKRDITMYQDLGCYLLNRYLGTQEKINNKFDIKTINMDQNVVYKFDHQNLKKIYDCDIFKEKYLSDKTTIGIHWYGGAKISQEYNNMINHTNIDDINNTLSSAIKYVLSYKGQ